MATIYDVARLAGVSVATTSKVLNNKGSVSSKLTKRVQAAVEALNYYPDYVARSLKSGRTRTIGIIVPDISAPFSGEVIRGVQAEARAHGYLLVFADANEDPALDQENLNMLLAHGVEGVLFSPTVVPFSGHETLIRRRIPLVLFNRASRETRDSAVVTDNFQGSYEAICHLLALGHERIAIIIGRQDLPNTRERLEGCRHAFQEANLPMRAEYLRDGEFKLEGGYQRTMELMRLPTPPTAIFALTLKMTLGVMRALQELHIPCPARVSVVGFDDFEWAANFNPRLTTVAQPNLEIGRQATKMLLRKIESLRNGEEGEEEKALVLKCKLCVRDSTAPPPSRHRSLRWQGQKRRHSSQLTGGRCNPCGRHPR